MYIDTDAHHGDGVQWSFYDDETVCTFSIHETGRYLFPGTGSTNEWGQGKGYGYSFNIPLDAFTEDESFIWAYSTALREIVEYFKPDVIFSQNGADAHYFDPLTHLSVTMNTYREIPKLEHALAHEYCEGRWISVGGGGYDIWRVVPRAWSLIWLEMTGKHASGPLPKQWLDRWKKLAPFELPKNWEDEPNLYKPIPRKEEITQKNAQTVERALYFLRQQLERERKKEMSNKVNFQPWTSLLIGIRSITVYSFVDPLVSRRCGRTTTLSCTFSLFIYFVSSLMETAPIS